jgi:ribosomal protein L13
MTKPRKKAKRKHSTEPVDMPQMPFEEAVKRMLSAPPQHKSAKKKNK